MIDRGLKFLLLPKREDEMRTKLSSNRWLSAMTHFLMLFWTLTCIIGTWFIIIKHEILFEGFAALAMTFFFGAFIWVIPLGGLLIISLYVSPTEEERHYVMFKDLIKKGMRSQKSMREISGSD
jgi:hypothetical protein